MGKQAFQFDQEAGMTGRNGGQKDRNAFALVDAGLHFALRPMTMLFSSSWTPNYLYL